MIEVFSIISAILTVIIALFVTYFWGRRSGFIDAFQMAKMIVSKYNTENIDEIMEVFDKTEALYKKANK